MVKLTYQCFKKLKNYLLIENGYLAWRPDEIVYVDWIGSWFANHFWAYLKKILFSVSGLFPTADFGRDSI